MVKPEPSREQALGAQEQRVLAEFCRQYSVPFRDLTLLKLALTHRSYLSVTGQGPRESNERLEFLGDSVLGLTTSEYLYRRHPDDHEGQLTKTKSLLVSKAILSRRALRMGLGRFVLMSHSEVESGGRQRLSILADAFESVLGAIYLDQGFEAARAFIHQHLLSESDAITSDKRHTNYKSHLQEYVQNAFRTHPVYRIRSEYGPDHSKHFMVEVMVGRRTLGEGRGHNKKEAEQAAARDALEKVEKVRRATRDESDEVVVEVVPEETPRERGRERGRGRHDEERGGRGRSRGRGDEDEREHPAAVVRTPAPPVLPEPELVDDPDDERDGVRDEGDESAIGRRRRRRRGGRRRDGARDPEDSLASSEREPEARAPDDVDDERDDAPVAPTREQRRDSFAETVRAEMRELTGDEHEHDEAPASFEPPRRSRDESSDRGRTFTPAVVEDDDAGDDGDWVEPTPRLQRREPAADEVLEPSSRFEQDVPSARTEPAVAKPAAPAPVAFGRGRRRSTSAAPAPASGAQPGAVEDEPSMPSTPEPVPPPVVDVTPALVEGQETAAERDARIEEMERALDNFGRRRSPDYGRRGRRR